MAMKEKMIVGGAFVASYALAFHGISERSDDRGNAYDDMFETRGQFEQIAQNIESQYPLAKTLEEIPSQARKELKTSATEYADATMWVDILDGETFELSGRQAKTAFNFGEILVGGTGTLITGYMGALEISRAGKKIRKGTSSRFRRKQATA